MPSRALREWRTTQRAELDRLDAAVRGTPERALRQQLVDAYILLVAGQFQLYCRRLHTEAAHLAAGAVQPPGAGLALKDVLMSRRQLDRGNAQPAALVADFRWLARNFWADLAEQDPANDRRRRQLEQLNAWRNAIAHQDFSATGPNPGIVAGSARTLDWARLWRSNCSALAQQMDIFVRKGLTKHFGLEPW